MKPITTLLRAAALLGALAASALAAPGGGPARQVDSAFIRANAATARDWPSHGLDYAETRFSRLAQINAGNAKKLGLVWSYDLESTRGVEATPLVVDGVMYVTASWSIVHAVNVRNGKRLWTYDPQVPRGEGYKACCDAVNRGAALYQGKVFVASLDGRLIALDAGTGRKIWERDTIADHKFSYTVTGAPRVYNGKVIIGNGGAEYGVRGYITAYDADSGEQKWRWFTVPGDPSKPFEDESMARAAKTWDPAGKYWEAGGGGTAWDSMAFDPELNLMYVGTGNGSPWSRSKRSPAGGDNLYLGSVVALNVDTGKYVWHYQETPGEEWDFTSTQQMVLADLTIAGKPRKVMLHAPKNGFFFVLDRVTGEFLSAKNYVDVNWATGYDAKGRPIETAIARAGERSREIIPSSFGAHSWHSMSFNPVTGLVYIPAQSIPMTLVENKDWKMNARQPGAPFSYLGWNMAMYANQVPPASKPFGTLIAWDPVRQKAAWTHEHGAPSNGGTLSTAGNLVFQGTADGRFMVFDARDGKVLWETPTGTGVVAAPVTYLVDGKQYVSIAVGWGGMYGQYTRHVDRKGPGTVYTFAIGGKARMPAFVDYMQGPLLSGVEYKPEHVDTGRALYISNCIFCHGYPGVERGGNLPNLAYVDKAYIENLDKFVFKGPFMGLGMPDFTGKLSEDDVEKIKAFIQGTADAIRPK